MKPGFDRFLFLLVALLNSCNSNSSAPETNKDTAVQSAPEKAPEKNEGNVSYDIAKPDKKWTLPNDLLEISGNAWIDDNHLLVNEDIRPILYLIKLDGTATIEKKIPFHKTSNEKFDIEDVTVVNHTAYALYSHGKLFKIDDWNGKPSVKEMSTFLGKENNTEGLCYDPVLNNLLVACKNKSDVDDEKKSTRALYEFDLKTETLKQTPFMLIHKKDISKMGGEKLDFYPSAIGVQPKTQDIYILSTKGSKVLAQYAHSGELKSIQVLDPDLLPQPEGICFSPDGRMYISTEGKHGMPAAIYQFNSNPAGGR